MLGKDYRWIVFTKYNCFGKTKVSKERQLTSSADADDLYKYLLEQLDKLDANLPKLFKEGTSSIDVIFANDLIISTGTVVNNGNILSDVFDEQNSVTKESDTSFIGTLYSVHFI